jgi:hypothetical protein
MGFRDGGFFVKETSEDGPATGDRLVACDGRSADAWAEAIIRDYVGPWSIRGARPRHAPWLMIDEGNPFVRPPRRCEFRGADGAGTSRELIWRAVTFDDLSAKIEAAQDHFQPAFALRSFGADGWWISLPSFDAGSPDTVAGLSRLIAEVESKADAIRTARVLVLDVRGNHGGDSNYGVRVAAALWGEVHVDAMKPRPVATDWRVSDENLRALKFFLKREQEQFGDASDAARSLAAVVSGMEAASAQHMTWCRETEPAAPAGVTPAPMRAKVYFLTDYACFSACLDFADLVIHIPGVVHVGQETSADAIYIDNNALRMPSGNGWLGYSMKVHRGRMRGNNESYQPALAWQGSMEDTDAIEAWIGGLAGDAP